MLLERDCSRCLCQAGRLQHIPDSTLYSVLTSYSCPCSKSGKTETHISPQHRERERARELQSPAPLDCLYWAIHLLIRIRTGAERKLQELSLHWCPCHRICKDAEQGAQYYLFKRESEAEKAFPCHSRTRPCPLFWASFTVHDCGQQQVWLAKW